MVLFHRVPFPGLRGLYVPGVVCSMVDAEGRDTINALCRCLAGCIDRVDDLLALPNMQRREHIYAVGVDVHVAERRMMLPSTMEAIWLGQGASQASTLLLQGTRRSHGTLS
jgi:hypothetical protein